MIGGAALLVLANLTSVQIARRVLLSVRIGEPSADFVLFLLVRLLFISAAVLGGGLAHALRGPALGLGAVICLLPFSFRKDLWRFPDPSRAQEVGPFLMGLAALVATKLLLQVWFFAPHSTDVLSYHLPKIAEWVRDGAFGAELGVDDHATFPAGFELLETWWVVFLHHDVLIEMAGVEYLLLVSSATLALGRRMGLSPRDAFLAAVAVAMTPGLALQATSCLNDGPVAALVVSTFALLGWGAPLPLLALPVGLGLGTKATFGYALPGIILGSVLFRRGAGRPASSVTAIALGAVGLAVGSYWYLRNFVAYGNPIYPVGRAELPIQTGPSLSSLVRNFRTLIDVRIYDRGPLGAYLDGISGWGALSFSCGIPGLALWMLQDPSARRWAASFILSLAGIFLLSRSDDWFMRFALFFPALLAIAGVQLLRICPRILPCFLIALGCQFLGTLLPYDLPLSDFRKLSSQSWRARTAAGFFGFEAESPVVGYLATNRGPAYCLYGPDYSRRVVYLRSRTPEELQAEIKRSGLRTLCVPNLGEEEASLVDECLKRGMLRRRSAHVLVALR